MTINPKYYEKIVQREKEKEKEEAHRNIAEADFEQLTPGFWAQKPSAMPLF